MTNGGFVHVSVILEKVMKEISEAYELAKMAEAEEADFAEEEVKVAEEPEPTLEEIRAALAEVSRAGRTGDVRTLLKKFNSTKLSEVKPEDYKAIMAEAKVMKDGI